MNPDRIHEDLPPRQAREVLVLEPSELEVGHREAWTRAWEGDRNLRNPYFRFEFAEAVAHHHPGVRVAISIGEEGPEAFWPFEEIRSGVAGPVGGKIGCLHGVVAAPGRCPDLEAFARAAKLRRWDFDHLPVAQEPFAPFIAETVAAPFIDVTDGFDAYLEARKAAGHSNRNISEAGRKLRKMGREVGEISFDPCSKDEEAMRLLVEWKREQMKSTGKPDLLQRSPWISDFVLDLLRRDDEGFRGMLSLLSAGGEPVAALFCLRSVDVAHGLFLGFNPQFGRYSPGINAILELTRQAEELGIRRIDMGKGEQSYKQTLMSGADMLGEGVFTVSPAAACWHRFVGRGKKAISRSSLGAPIKSMVGRASRLVDRVGSEGR